MSATNYFEKPSFSPEAGVITVRPSSTALLTIDSEDRFQKGFIPDASGNVVVPATGYPLSRYILSLPKGAYNATPYDFTIVKNESIMNGFFTRLGLTEVCFPFGIPNINKKTSQIGIEWTVSGSATLHSNVVTMNPNYEFLTPTKIATELTGLVQIVASDLSEFDMIYGGTPNIPYFTYTTGTPNVQIAFQPMPNGTSNYPYPASTKQLFDLLGFTTSNTILEETANGQSTLCQATRYVDIICSQLTYNQPLKDTMTQPIARDSLCRLYLGDGNGFGNNTAETDASNFTPPGCAPFTIYRQFQTPKMINWNSAGKAYQPVPGVLRFEVVDDTGANLTEMVEDTDLFTSAGDYLDWSATILVSEN